MGMFDPRAVLRFPGALHLFKRVISSGRARRVLVDGHLRPRVGQRVLDIGCGTGDVLEYLPEVDYHGFDLSERYIEQARERYGHRGRFTCQSVTRFSLGPLEGSCDLVLASGVLHHLDDLEAVQLCEVARAALVSGGRLVTIDGCFTADQGRISRFLLSRDRGRFVRRDHEYIELAHRVFDDVKSRVYDDLLRVPYTHIVVESTRE